MNRAYNFSPLRRRALIFHIAAIFILSAIGAVCFWQASRANVGLTFLLFLVPALAAILLIPLLIYRLYALHQAGYVIQRDGLRLGWGLRIEDIPMDQVTWVRPASEIEGRLPLPPIRWPGSILGVRHLADGETLEYFASDEQNMILIATHGRVFVISPEDPEAFIRTYQRCNEYGSLTPIPARSVYPSFLLARVWSDRPARYLILASILMGLILFTLVSLEIPARSSVALQVAPGGIGLDLVPAIQLFLLPVLLGGFVMVDLIGGLFFYRKEERKPLAYLLWGSADFTALTFLLAVLFILNAR